MTSTTKRRKQAYEALHPETRHGAIGNGRESRKLCDSTPATGIARRFTADTAANTGQSERAPLTLMALWKRHKPECRSIGAILADARQGKLPGAVETDRGSIIITNERAALAAMTEGTRHG